MIHHKPYCVVNSSVGLHDDANCNCGATRRSQRKGAPPSPLGAIDKLSDGIREEIRILRTCSTEAAISLSLDQEAIRASCARMRDVITNFERDLFDRPELPLTGRPSR